MVDECVEENSSLRRLRDGNLDALAELFGFFRPRLRQMIRLRMQGPLEARVDPSDVLQETFLDASRRISEYLAEPKVSPFVWFRGLTLDRLKKIQREHLGTQCRAVGRELRLPKQSSVLAAFHLIANGPSPSNALLEVEMKERVKLALAAVKEEDREILLMRHFEGMSNREVAETLGLSVSGATMRHGRALFRLKEVLMADLSDEESKP